MKTLQNPVILTTKLQTFTSKLATMPSTSISNQISPSITMSQKLKYSPETITAFEKIMKFYDYKSNQEILRCSKVSKYPRYLCSEISNPDVVEKLFAYGFIDKIVVTETLQSISKLPTIIVDSVNAMMESFGKGAYGIQIFDASTDLVGKPIVICQIFKIGKNTNITGDYKELKLPEPCTIDKFQDWLSAKRAIGLLTLKSKLEDMMKAGKSTVIASGKGGQVEEIITLYYSHEAITADSTAFQGMYDRIINLKHAHAKTTIEQYQEMIGPKKRPIVTNTIRDIKIIKEEGSSDPFK